MDTTEMNSSHFGKIPGNCGIQLPNEAMSTMVSC